MNSLDPWRLIITDEYGDIVVPQPRYGHPFYSEVPSWINYQNNAAPRVLFDGAFISGDIGGEPVVAGFFDDVKNAVLKYTGTTATNQFIKDHGLEPYVRLAATGVATAYGGPAAGAAAGALSGPVMSLGIKDKQKEAVAQKHVQQVSNAVQQQSPELAPAVDIAHDSINKTATTYHVAKITNDAKAGHGQARRALRNLQDAAARGDVQAQRALQLASVIDREQSRAAPQSGTVSGWVDIIGANMTNIIGAVGDFDQLNAELSRFWQVVQANLKAAEDRIASEPEYQVIQDAWRAEEARYRTLTSLDARIASVDRMRALQNQRYSLYQHRKQAFPVLVWGASVFEPVRMQLLSLGERIKAHLSGSSAEPIYLSAVVPPAANVAEAIEHYRALLTALQNSAPFAPYPNKGFRAPGVESARLERLGADPQAPRTDLTTEIGPVLAPASRGISVNKHLDDKQILHVEICVDGKCHKTSMDLAPAIAMLMQKLARWHEGQHAPQPPPSTVVNTVQAAVGAAEDMIIGALVARHIDTVAAGLLGDIAGAVSSAVKSVGGGVADTFKKFKGPIGAAAGIAAAAGASMIPGVGLIAAPMAAKLANDLVQSTAGDTDAQKKVKQAAQQAKTDPAVAVALEQATKAVANSTAAHHIQDTAKKAARGDAQSQQKIAQVATDAEKGDPAAKAVADLVANAMKSEWGAKLWEKVTGRGPGTVSGWHGSAVGQWYEMIGAALDDVREKARAHAVTKPGTAAGVLVTVDGKLHGRGFRNLDDAIDWLQHITRNRGSFTYAAAYEKDSEGAAFIQAEEIGGTSQPAPAPTTIPREGPAMTGWWY
jgi:hypothetical protein